MCDPFKISRGQRSAHSPTVEVIGVESNASMDDGDNREIVSRKGKRKRQKIYPVFSPKDNEVVRLILSFLKQENMVVYCTDEVDSADTEVITSQTGPAIYKSTISLIFLSHHYMKCEDCKVKTSTALGRMQSENGHKVVCIMIQSCKVPKSLRHVYCWYVWKDSPQLRNSKILTAITGQPTGRDETQLRGRNKFIIHCANDECNFRVYCDNITEAQRHKERCKYRPEKCKFCRIEVPRKSLEKHEQRICKSRRVECPNTGCGVSTTLRERKKHDYNCQYSMAYLYRKYLVLERRKDGHSGHRQGSSKYEMELDSDLAESLTALFELRNKDSIWARILQAVKGLKREDRKTKEQASEQEETVTVRNEYFNPAVFKKNVASACTGTSTRSREPRRVTNNYFNVQQSNSNAMTLDRRNKWAIMMDMINSGNCTNIEEVVNDLIPMRGQRNIYE